MLVAISDLHFVDGTAGEHNLPSGAFQSVFLSDIAALVKDKKAEKLTLLLLGDVFDLLRSEKWFDAHPDNRPWGKNGMDDVSMARTGTETEEMCFKILGRLPDDGSKKSVPQDTILYKNWETFEIFRNLKSDPQKLLKKDIEVEVVYVLGNHDRLINVYPGLRNEVAKILGLKLPKEDDSTPARFPYEYLDEAHGVYAQHGHQYDIWNYGGGDNFTLEGQLKTPIGDVFTTEFAVAIPYTLGKMGASPELANKMKDIDNVRPLSAVMEWIYYRLKGEDQKSVREKIDKTFETVISGLLDIGFVQQWRSPKTHIDELLRAASSRWLSWLPKGLVDRCDAEDLLPLIMGVTGDDDDPAKDRYVQAAYSERKWKHNRDINYVLYGHTHKPLQIPLDSDDHEVVYINTGTWRNRLFKTVAMDKAPDFMELKQMTYSIFYNANEDLDGKEEGTRSFDVWSGIKGKRYSKRPS